MQRGCGSRHASCACWSHEVFSTASSRAGKPCYTPGEQTRVSGGGVGSCEAKRIVSLASVWFYCAQPDPGWRKWIPKCLRSRLPYVLALWGQRSSGYIWQCEGYVHLEPRSTVSKPSFHCFWRCSILVEAHLCFL